MSNRYDRRMLKLKPSAAKPRATEVSTIAVITAAPARNKLSRLELRALGLLDKRNNPIKP